MKPHPVFEKGFLVLGHRGTPLRYPENTMAGFAGALEEGAHGIELDVRITKDGVPVVFHDARLNRMTNGRGFLKSKTLSEIKQLTIAGAFAPAANANKIPTLEEVLQAFGKKTILNIEIKGHPRKADALAEKLLSLIHRYHDLEKTIISSFNPIPLRRVRKLEPDIATAFLIDKNFFIRRTEKAIYRLAGMNAVHIEAGLVNPQFLYRLRSSGFYCLVWGEYDPHHIGKLIELGVNGIITDYPGTTVKQLERLCVS